VSRQASRGVPASHAVRRLDLFVTEGCNLACPYCFAATHPRKNPSDEEALRAVDWLLRSESERVHITLWGGEPLLRRALIEKVVTHAKDQARRLNKRVGFSMPTNATRLDEDVARWLDEQGVRIFLSIDGDEEGQRTRPLKRGGSSHRLAQIGLKNAVRARPKAPPSVRMTVTPDNAARQGPSARYLLGQGAKELLVYPAFDQPWSEDELARFEAGQREMAELFVELVRSSDDPGTIPVFKAWRPILRRLLDGVPARRREGELKHCGAGAELVALTVDGQLAPCHRFVFYARERDDDVGLGDLERGLDAERAGAYGGLRVEQMRGVTRCVECEHFDLCTFGCIAISYATTGALDVIPEAVCRLMEAQIRVCREIHAALRRDPRYVIYLGRTVNDALSATARELGRRALRAYRSTTEGGLDGEARAL